MNIVVILFEAWWRYKRQNEERESKREKKIYEERTHFLCLHTHIFVDNGFCALHNFFFVWLPFSYVHNFSTAISNRVTLVQHSLTHSLFPNGAQEDSFRPVINGIAPTTTTGSTCAKWLHILTSNVHDSNALITMYKFNKTTIYYPVAVLFIRSLLFTSLCLCVYVLLVCRIHSTGLTNVL